MIAISIPIPLITVVWIAACALIGLLAVAKGRSFVSWSVAAVVASPVVVLLLFFLPNKTNKKTPTPPKRVPPKLPAPPSKAALPIKAIKALAYRVETSRVVGALSRRKSAAYRSIEKFTAAAEIDKGFAVTVRDEFSNEVTAQIPAGRKTRS